MRLERSECWPLEPGQWIRLKTGDRENLLVACGRCGKAADLASHDVTEHPDGTITVRPSLVCPFGNCGWHVWIDHSEVLEA